MGKILDKILKLFELGGVRANSTEAEMLAAVTKARQLMVQHKISQADVQAALDAKTDAAKKIRIDINQYTAYTRKMKNLARYDEILAMAVGELTDTEPILNRKWSDGWYVSMTFIGEQNDIALASALFMIWLPEVRRAARQMFGSQEWKKPHTSYAIGYAARILDRAQAAMPDQSVRDANAMALVMSATKDAIASYKKDRGVMTGKDRKFDLDPFAYHKGFSDGGQFNMATKVVR